MHTSICGWNVARRILIQSIDFPMNAARRLLWYIWSILYVIINWQLFGSEAWKIKASSLYICQGIRYSLHDWWRLEHSRTGVTSWKLFVHVNSHIFYLHPFLPRNHQASISETSKSDIRFVLCICERDFDELCWLVGYRVFSIYILFVTRATRETSEIYDLCLQFYFIR